MVYIISCPRLPPTDGWLGNVMRGSFPGLFEGVVSFLRFVFLFSLLDDKEKYIYHTSPFTPICSLSSSRCPLPMGPLGARGGGEVTKPAPNGQFCLARAQKHDTPISKQVIWVSTGASSLKEFGGSGRHQKKHISSPFPPASRSPKEENDREKKGVVFRFTKSR
jgi:hypothetical protein